MNRLAACALLAACRIHFDGVPAPVPHDGAVSPDAQLGYRETVLADLPLSYWRFGEAAGTLAMDERGVAPGTYTAAGLGRPGAIGDGNLAIEVASATGGHMAVSDIYGFGGGAPFSLEIWVHPASFGGNVGNFMFSKEDTTDGYQFGLGTGGASFLRRIKAGATDEASGATPPLGTWSYVVGTFDGSTLNIYVNGVATGSAGSTQVITGAPGLVFTVGARSQGGSGFDGLLDEAAVYDTFLSAAQIRAHCVAAQNPDVRCP